jgi:hypothetical protein
MANQIEELVGQIFSLIRYNAKIAENAFDPELIADLYYKISLSYFNSPNLRVTWLNNLAAYHTTVRFFSFSSCMTTFFPRPCFGFLFHFSFVQNGKFEESAQAKIHVAYLVVQYLQRNGHSLPLTKDTFVSVSPVIHLEPGLPESNDQSLFQSASNVWSVAGLIKQLQEAETLLEKAGHFELAMEMYSILSLIFKKERMWAELIESLQFYKTMAEKVVEVVSLLSSLPPFFSLTFSFLSLRTRIFACSLVSTELVSMVHSQKSWTVRNSFTSEIKR